MKIFKHTSKSAAVAALVGILAGCSSGGGSGEVDSGLPEDTPANELSEDETEQLCDAYVDAASDTIASIDVCAYSGYLTAALTFALGGGEEADLREACSQAQAACEDNPDAVEEPTAPDCLAGEEPSGTCEATVGELEDCLQDRLDQSEALFDTPEDCSTLTTDGLTEYLENSGEVPEETAACQAVNESCPDGL